jgi:hypothetical protein
MYTKDNALYKLVTALNGRKIQVFDSLMHRWDLLKVDDVLDFVYEKKEGSQYPDLVDIRDPNEKDRMFQEQIAVQCVVDLWDKDIPPAFNSNFEAMKEKALVWIEKKLR